MAVALARRGPGRLSGWTRSPFLLPGLVVAGLGAGVCAGVVGGAAGVAVMLGLPVALGLLLAAVDRPVLAVVALLVCQGISLRSIGPGGVQVIHVLALFAILAVVLGHWALRLPWPRSDAVQTWALTLAVVALLAAVVSGRVLRGLRVDLNLLLGVGIYLCVVAVVRDRADIRLLLRGAVGGSLVATVPALGNIGQMRGSYGGAIVDNRLMGVFTQPNEMGSYAVTILFLSMTLFIAAGRNLDRLLAAGAAGAAGGCLVFSLSRGSWIGTLTGLLVLVILFPPAMRYLATAFVALGTLLAALLVLNPFPAQTAIVIARFTTLTEGSTNPDDRRDLIWAEALRMLGDRPVLGYGPGSFQREPAGTTSLIADYYRLHAHNVILHAGAETGLLGITAVVGLSLAVAWKAYRAVSRLRRLGRNQDAALVACLISGCAAYTTHGLVDFVFQNQLLMILIWTMVGLVVVAVRVTVPEHPPSRPADRHPVSPAGGQGPASPVTAP